MVKYWAIWGKSQQRWWRLYRDWWVDDWTVMRKITKEAKMINGIPIWDTQNFGLENLEDSSDWEVAPFTPTDALLAKCGKI